MKKYGTVNLEGSNGSAIFRIKAVPHVLMRLKSVFEKIDKREHGQVSMTATAEHCRDLEWFLQRFPMKLETRAHAAMLRGSTDYTKRLEALEKISLPTYKPRDFDMAKPLRHYQAQAVEVTLGAGSLLLADQLGLGKTVSAIGLIAAGETTPSLVVCQTHLAKQWEAFLAEFLPAARAHVIKTTKPYNLPAAEVYIITYHKLSAWADVLAQPWAVRSIIFDEVQELRHDGTGKYMAAKAIRNACQFALGLSATPIYNYGGEIFNVLGIVTPNRLGSWEEFSREWCSYQGDKVLLRDPAAFGAYLRDEHLMLRRTRADVGLELPPVERVTQMIPHNVTELAKIQSSATELARIILEGTFTQQGQAAREFDAKLRQATGIAKAPFVAEFVRMLVEDGQKVILFGWHREVYDVWLDRMADLSPVLYTGSESPAAKEKSKAAFVSGEAKILIMSLRSGSGVDGLQLASSTVVFGELDWSPGIHEQCIGRANRDGLEGSVTAFFLVSDGGADPLMASVLGLKTAQAKGVTDPSTAGEIETLQSDGDRVKKMARAYLAQRKAA